jgi:hypothetical protein
LTTITNVSVDGVMQGTRRVGRGPQWRIRARRLGNAVATRSAATDPFDPKQ